MTMNKSMLHAHQEDFKIQKRILQTVEKNLSGKNKVHAEEIASSIMKQAFRYHLDPYIIAAVIKGESNFNPRAVGSMGEIGLMQLKEKTAIWISRKMHLKWEGKKSLYNPVRNIELGSAYLGYLNGRLGKSGGYLYLAAYNMGYYSVARNLAKKIHPEIYSKHIMKKYLTLNESTSTVL
jgi:soluble lytic murein transglycosylase-like protein